MQPASEFGADERTKHSEMLYSAKASRLQTTSRTLLSAADDEERSLASRSGTVLSRKATGRGGMQPDQLKEHMAYFARKGSEAQRFLSPAEQLRENKAKMKVKAYIQKFFNLAAMKRLQVYFWIWYSRVEVQREEAKIYNTGFGAVSTLIEFNNKLKDEKNRAKSKILLDGFASLN